MSPVDRNVGAPELASDDPLALFPLRAVPSLRYDSPYFGVDALTSRVRRNHLNAVGDLTEAIRVGKVSGKETLARANQGKRDEFYTQLADVEAELRHYRDQFRGKTILCNCDDPYESAFFKYFAMNFNYLGLKKLIATSYSGSPIAGEQLSLFDCPNVSPGAEKRAYKVEITEVVDATGDGATGLSDVEALIRHDANVLILLDGNGDFRSPECVALLYEADIIVTNPPFSLFREYVAQLVEHAKQFLILGNQNAITYSEIFKLIKDNRLWLGYDNGGEKWFRVPDDYDHTSTESRIKVEGGIRYLNRPGKGGGSRTRRMEPCQTTHQDPSGGTHPSFASGQSGCISKRLTVPASGTVSSAESPSNSE